MKKIIGVLDYVMGHLRDGHFELILTEEEYKEFDKLSEQEQIKWLRDGDFKLDDYSIEDFGEIKKIEIRNVQICRGTSSI
jgi:nicotinic acid phosphoribosyltransferase